MIVYILLQNLDQSTKLWFVNEFGRNGEIPKFRDTIDFVKISVRILEASRNSNNVNQMHCKKQPHY